MEKPVRNYPLNQTVVRGTIRLVCNQFEGEPHSGSGGECMGNRGKVGVKRVINDEIFKGSQGVGRVTAVRTITYEC